MATTEDDGIEILSCHVIDPEEEAGDNSTSTSVSFKIANGDVADDPATKQRKRVARAVGVVTFIFLVFSIVLIGVSLNMSKNIDDMAGVRASDRHSDNLNHPQTAKVEVSNTTILDLHFTQTVTFNTKSSVRQNNDKLRNDLSDRAKVTKNSTTPSDTLDAPPGFL